MKSQFMSERPRERCLAGGARCLSARELIAVILGSGPPGKGALGLAAQILERPGVGLDAVEMDRAFYLAMESNGRAHLREVKGLGEAGQARILAAFELGRRYANFRSSTQGGASRARAGWRRLDHPEQAIDRVPGELRSEPLEWLGFVPLHRGRTLGNFCLVERGVRTHVNVDPVELFARLLSLRPVGFYLFHNHPSGDLTPSPEDEELTRRVRQVAAQFGIQLLGHGILDAHGERWIVI